MSEYSDMAGQRRTGANVHIMDDNQHKQSNICPRALKLSVPVVQEIMSKALYVIFKV